MTQAEPMVRIIEPGTQMQKVIPPRSEMSFTEAVVGFLTQK